MEIVEVEMVEVEKVEVEKVEVEKGWKRVFNEANNLKLKNE